jgi:hypothetical protein
MHRLTLGIQLKHKRCRAFGIVGVFLDHDGSGHAGKNFVDRKAVVSQGVIAVLRYAHVPCRD